MIFLQIHIHSSSTDHRLCSSMATGICTFARTDTRLFHELIFPNADSILFIKGRLSFYHVTGEQGGTAGAPSCLIAFNKENTAVLETCGIDGKLVKPRLQ